MPLSVTNGSRMTTRLSPRLQPMPKVSICVAELATDRKQRGTRKMDMQIYFTSLILA